MSDKRFLDHLQKQHRNCLGFLPDQAFDVVLSAGYVHMAIENGEPAGYIIRRPQLACSPDLSPIIQAAVEFDAQRRKHGLHLLDQVARDAKAQGAKALTLWCAQELAANDFWCAAGFILVGSRDPANVRKRRLNLWRLALTWPLPPAFFGRPRRAGYYAKLSGQIALTHAARHLAQAPNLTRLQIMDADQLRYARPHATPQKSLEENEPHHARS